MEIYFTAPGDIFVVQWDKVRLKDRETEGAFTFQTVLYGNGTIVFSYKDVSQAQMFNLAQFNQDKLNTHKANSENFITTQNDCHQSSVK